MKTYVLTGEDFNAILPLDFVDSKEFSGVMVYRFWGSEIGIKASTNILTERYPTCRMTTLGDAKWLGKVKSEEQWIDLYELIVMRETANEKI